MKSFRAKIIDPIGLHARPAAIIVKIASQFESQITLVANDKKANMKSIMNVMALAIKCGQDIEVIIEGNDEANAIIQIEKEMKFEKLIN